MEIVDHTTRLMWANAIIKHDHRVEYPHNLSLFARALGYTVVRRRNSLYPMHGVTEIHPNGEGAQFHNPGERRVIHDKVTRTWS